jgi:sterol desaturase/sphingolipid hydroxylase (fatty acid hydroxylase superfamily)
MQDWVLANADALQFELFFGLLIVFGIAEALAPRREGAPRGMRWVTNFVLTTLNVVVMSILPITIFSAAVWSARHHVGLLNLVAIPAVVLVLTTLLARGFISFFTHYLAHKVPFLWRIHRVHHLDTELDISTTVRFHPAEFVVNLAIGVPIVVALGLSPWVLLLYEVFDAAVTLFSHANVRIPAAIDRALRYLIVTPDLHRVHHSAWQTETDSNFGAVFPIWDIVFGTFRTSTREPHETMALGLEVRDGREQRLKWLLGSPLNSRFDATEK